MSATPAKGRLSSLPTPTKSSGIPTPGRLRSSSSVNHHHPPGDDIFMAKALEDAIRSNDPGKHRISDSSASSLSLPPSQHLSTSGRRSVAGRPSSSASSSSAFSALNSSTSPGLAYARPPSRSSAVPRSSSRAGASFELGDNVRIESLGFEGTLRYLGEINGKAGEWAGVELSGGFAGKGKNDGTVAGIQYFVCPPYCGVFVAASKLSMPTVNYSSISRPSSVASTRNGRITPSISGRITPSSSISFTNGRKTPSYAPTHGRTTPSLSNGRITPAMSAGRKTPAQSSRSYAYTPKPTTTPSKSSNNKVSESNITPGSRASKYVGMTAKQLSTRGSTIPSPTRSGLPSPSPTLIHAPSPTRNSSSSFNTPKAGRSSSTGITLGTPSKGRPSISSTPRPRIPSAIAMPPPASPSSAIRSMPHKDHAAFASQAPVTQESLFSDLQANSRELSSRIADLVSGQLSMPHTESSSRPSSSSSMHPTPTTESLAEMERLQARLDALTNENDSLRSAAEAREASLSVRYQDLVTERDKSTARIAELETSLRTAERSLKDREVTHETLERVTQEMTKDVEKVRSEGEARLRDTQSRLEDCEALVNHLKQALEAKEGEQNQSNVLMEAKNKEIEVLGNRVQKAYAELEEERRDLGGHVDELRKAGQETIALYEERLSVADSRRYEMEDLIASLEEQLRAQTRPLSPTASVRQTSSAVEIDNEALREQVQHLQRKIASLEDLLEDTRVMSEREEGAVRERMKRYKDREDGMRKEVADMRREVEQRVQSESHARARVEEIEEALRENTVALENARADVEGLRSEIAHLEGLQDDIPRGSSSSRTSNDHSQLLQEIHSLKQKLADQVAPEAMNQASTFELNSLRSSEAALIDSCRELAAELALERQVVVDLQKQLEQQGADLETARKKVNRDVPVNGIQLEGEKGIPATISQKQDVGGSKDEIKGFKHIIQELQQENSISAQRCKVLEAENNLLGTEVKQLRQNVILLEESMEQKLVCEERALQQESDFVEASSLSDVVSLQQRLRDLKASQETEVEQLRKRNQEAEMKSARTIHQLNKEIGELESLIEAKIYHEDELEREVERLQEKLARSQKKSSRSGVNVDSVAVKSNRIAVVGTGGLRGGSEELCEICERPGHDIFTCDLLKDDGGKGGAGLDGMFCEDCEERGHTAANCPHSLDVF